MLNPNFALMLKQEIAYCDPSPALKEMAWRLVTAEPSHRYVVAVAGCTVSVVCNCETPTKFVWYATAEFGQASPYRYGWSAQEALKQLWDMINTARKFDPGRR